MSTFASSPTDMSYSEALFIVLSMAETGHPDEDEIDDLEDEVLEIVMNQGEALEAITSLLADFSAYLDNLPTPVAGTSKAPVAHEIQLDSVFYHDVVDEDEDDDEPDYSDPFNAIELGLLMASMSIAVDADELKIMDQQTADEARSAIQMVEYMLDHHRAEIARIAHTANMPLTMH